MPFVRALCILAAIVAVWAVTDHHDPDDMLLGVIGFPALWRHWREHLVIERRVAPNTVTAYRKAVWSFNDSLGTKRWNRAGPRDLQRFIDRPSAAGGRVSANTARNNAQAVVLLYRFAYRRSYVGSDRMAAFTPPRGGQPQIRSLEQGELRAVLVAADALDDRLYVMASLAYYAGLRCAEIAELRVEDVDLRRRHMIVNGKGGKRRPIPIYPELAATLSRYLTGRPLVGPLVCSVRFPDRPLTPHTISTHLSRLIHGLGIDGSGHGLRHSFATELLEAAGEQKLYTVSKLLGHADTSVTERVYTLRYRGEPEQVIAQLPDPRRSLSPRTK